MPLPGGTAIEKLSKEEWPGFFWDVCQRKLGDMAMGQKYQVPKSRRFVKGNIDQKRWFFHEFTF